jgi:hypothetical protein
MIDDRYRCILLELSVGHDIFCDEWMPAYDYGLMQDAPKFQVCSVHESGGHGWRDGLMHGAGMEGLCVMLACLFHPILPQPKPRHTASSPSSPQPNNNTAPSTPLPPFIHTHTLPHTHTHTPFFSPQARLQECRAAIEGIMREKLRLNAPLVDFILGLLTLDPAQRYDVCVCIHMGWEFFFGGAGGGG